MGRGSELEWSFCGRKEGIVQSGRLHTGFLILPSTFRICAGSEDGRERKSERPNGPCFCLLAQQTLGERTIDQEENIDSPFVQRQRTLVRDQLASAVERVFECARLVLHQSDLCDFRVANGRGAKVQVRLAASWVLKRV